MAKMISIKVAAPGDVLASKVVTASGGVLLQAGVKLTKAYLEKLKKIGISTIVIG